MPFRRPNDTGPADVRRTRDVAQFLVAVRDWAEAQTTVRAAAVVGSWARGNARMNSDLDLVVLSSDPDGLLDHERWSQELGQLAFLGPREWGPLTEVRFALSSGLEIDFGVAPLSWAALDPVDDGTREVICGGISILYDPDRLLKRLMSVRSHPHTSSS
jgi:predicted nucleotidyltransferase